MSLIQLIVLAVGMAVSLVIWNAMVRNGASKTTSAVFAVPVFIIFVVIAFFNISEMGLLAFIAKVVRTNFLDMPKKFQDDYQRIDPVEIAIKKSQADDDQKKVNKRKTYDMTDEQVKKIQKDDIF